MSETKQESASNTILQEKADKDLSRSYGTNWNSATVCTLFEWLCIASFKIACLELASGLNRNRIRNVTILGLFLSTLSGTVSVGSFGVGTDDAYTQKILSGFFTFLSFAVAISTGYLKVYQVQEQLEQYIKLKQDWVIFSTTIASELQLPTELRRDGLWVIIKNKSTYLDLLKTDVEIPTKIYKQVFEQMPQLADLRLDVSRLSNIILDIGIQELTDIQKKSGQQGLPKEQIARTAIQNAVQAQADDRHFSSVVRNIMIKNKFTASSLADNSKYTVPIPKIPEEDSPSKITLVIREEEEAPNRPPLAHPA